jgi:hypothetical protein
MFFSAIPDIIVSPDAVMLINTKLGYPSYFTSFIGVAKVLGVIAILIPGFPRIKEWAYAGLGYDLIGATYSLISIGTPVSGWVFMFVPLIVGALSYFFYHKKLRASLLKFAEQ